MSAVIIALFLAVPCALGAWLWWSMRKIGGKRTAYSSRKAQRPPQTFGKIPEASARVDRVERPPRDFSHALQMQGDAERLASTTFVDAFQKPQSMETPKPTPKQQTVGTVEFLKDCKYIASDDRVYECLGFKGRKDRRAAFYDFGELEYWPKKRNDHPDYFFWYLIRMDGTVETCDRGRLRADRMATQQQANEYARQVKEREDGQRAYWAERKAKRERDAKRLAELEKLVKDKGLE